MLCSLSTKLGQEEMSAIQTLEKELGRLRRPADPSLSNRFAVTDR